MNIKGWSHWPVKTGYNWVRRGKGKPKIVNVEQREKDGALVWHEGQTAYTLHSKSPKLLWQTVTLWR